MGQDSSHPSDAGKLAEIEYPLDFPIKVMGRREPGFVRKVIDVVRKHAPDFDETTIEMRQSKKNTYLSVTCTIVAVSREQLDALYKELGDHPAVAMVL
jgi:putative lipoic acid-binding regulatory protein